MLRKLNYYQKIQIVSLIWLVGAFFYGSFFRLNLDKNTAIWLRLFEYLKTLEGGIIAFAGLVVFSTVIAFGMVKTKNNNPK